MCLKLTFIFSQIKIHVSFYYLKLTREYGIQIPDSYDHLNPIPLVLDIHGWTVRISREYLGSGMKEVLFF